MSKRFPHLTNNQSEFPNIQSVDVYKYDNDFDYSRYDFTQMKLTVCKVPWDMGEAHVGNRTISGIGNVVWFETTDARDEWFDSIPDDECIRYETKYRALHRDNQIKVDIPFDVASTFNYVAVEYTGMANDDSPILNENASGRRKWFWFIREVEFLSPNTTLLHLMIDAFQTFMYDVTISSMVLERGHAPAFRTKTDSYLANPIDNCADLLAPDEDYGDTGIVANTFAHVFNVDKMKTVVITSSQANGAWGSAAGNNWQTPADYGDIIQGVIGHTAFAFDAIYTNNFFTTMASSMPNFAQTVEAVCFISADLLDIGTEFTLFGVTCNLISADYKTTELHQLSKDDFGYPTEYADFAKLYTYPYAYIRVTDGNGSSSEIHIENTNGTISFEHSISLVFPWINLSGHLTGIGKANKRTINFANVDARSMPIQGNWSEYLIEWQIPTFSILQSGEDNYDFSAYYDREQQRTAYTNTYTSEIASADTLVTNAALTVATNSSVTTRSNTSAQTDATNTYQYNSDSTQKSNYWIAQSADSQIAAAEKQAAVSSIGSVVSGAVNAGASGAAGNPLGAVTSAIGGIIGAVTTQVSTAIATGLTATESQISQDSNTGAMVASNILTGAKVTNQIDTQTDITDYHNALTSGTAANTAATQKANAGRTRSTAISAIDNAISQAALNAPISYGNAENGANAANKPMALFTEIVTENDYAISRAGDEFARYGYAYGKQWPFNGNWNIGKYFTYWKLSDFWIAGLDVPDLYMDRLRFFLFGGVTIWRRPEYIGKISIYDNMEA